MRERGMTLVEVLVALAILGLVAASIVALIGQNTRFISNAEEQMIAGIIADNAMVDALGRIAPLERNTSEKELQTAGRSWRVATTVEDSPVPGLVRIDIAVRAGASDQVLASASTLKIEQ